MTRACPLGKGSNPVAFRRVTASYGARDGVGAPGGRNHKNRITATTAAASSTGAGILTRIDQNRRQPLDETRCDPTADRYDETTRWSSSAGGSVDFHSRRSASKGSVSFTSISFQVSGPAAVPRRFGAIRGRGGDGI